MLDYRGFRILMTAVPLLAGAALPAHAVDLVIGRATEQSALDVSPFVTDKDGQPMQTQGNRLNQRRQGGSAPLTPYALN